jgi:hypothetical protein
MQSTNIRQIRAAIGEQAFLGTTQVSCPLGSVVAVSRRKGQLRVMIRGWGAGTTFRVSELSAPDKSCSRRV